MSRVAEGWGMEAMESQASVRLRVQELQASIDAGDKAMLAEQEPSLPESDMARRAFFVEKRRPSQFISSLEYENEVLVKVNGHRPAYMNGADLIRTVRELASDRLELMAELAELKGIGSGGVPAIGAPGTDDNRQVVAIEDMPDVHRALRATLFELIEKFDHVDAVYGGVLVQSGKKAYLRLSFKPVNDEDEAT